MFASNSSFSKNINLKLPSNQSFNYFSPNLTGKKSNEIIQGGLSSIKSAVTSAAKKFDEIKQTISNNNTPIKSGGGSNSSTLEREKNLYSSNDDLLTEDGVVTNGGLLLKGGPRRRVSSEFDLWGRLSDSRKSSYNNLVPLGEQVANSTNSLNTYPLLPDNVYANDNVSSSS